MTKEDMAKMIQDFIDDGGAITKLRYADKKAQDKASRMSYHRDKAVCGSERSKKVIERESKRESNLIFSRDDRWSE